MSHDFRFPSGSQRTTVIGRTGSGKTQFGVWLLSEANYHAQPWVILDFKGDDLIADIPHMRELSLKDTAKKPGLYVVRPTPHQTEEVENFLWRIWQRGKTGVFFDEGYMVAKSDALNALLTQGRSLKIPAIILAQRPSWISRFVFSEADFYSVFHLNDRRDRKLVQEFCPPLPEMLPDYHSSWYDVGKHKLFTMQPVPDHDSILQTFNDRLKPRRSFL